MIDLKNMFERDLSFAHAHCPQSVTYGGRAYPCAYADRRTGAVSEYAYEAPESEVDIRLQKSTLAGWTPARGQLVSIDGERLQVDHLLHTPDGLEVVLFCVADHRR